MLYEHHLLITFDRFIFESSVGWFFKLKFFLKFLLFFRIDEKPSKYKRPECILYPGNNVFNEWASIAHSAPTSSDPSKPQHPKADLAKPSRYNATALTIENSPPLVPPTAIAFHHEFRHLYETLSESTVTTTEKDASSRKILLFELGWIFVWS